MKVELLTFGNELLDGRRIDTNTAWLGRRLSLMGFPPSFRFSTNDTLEDISAAFKTALTRSDVIISTGGLGPTQDDLTFEALGKALNQPLTFREAIWENILDKFSKRGLRCPEANKRQAMLPEKAQALKNDLGTAPGLYANVHGKHIFCLPGVPKEMEFIFDDSMVFMLKAIFGNERITHEFGYYFVGLPESQLEEEVEASGIRNYPHAEVQIAYTASFPQIDLTLSVKPKGTQKSTQDIHDDLENMLMHRLEKHLLSRSTELIEENIIRHMANNNWKLGVAESMTGGLLSGRLISVPGSSKVIDVSLITYSNDMKQKLLDVSADTLKSFGSVSKECALEMAKGMCTKFGASVGISTTGIAGPDGATLNKPVGLTYVAMYGPLLEEVGMKDGVVKEFRFQLDRNKNRTITVYEALKMLWKNLPQGKKAKH